jgi:hypothetical protein
MITVGDIRNGVLHEMREYSNSGSVITSTDNKDYLLSIIPLINVYQKELATTTNKIERKIEISHHMPVNQLGYIQWNEARVHAGGVNDEFSAQGSRGYSITASGYFNFVVQEEISGVWTTLVNTTHTPTSGEGDVTYKGKLTLTSTSNKVRIVLNSAYRHPYRWVALYSDVFYNDAAVPAFDPYVPYDLPSDFYKLKEIKFAYPERQFNSYSAYKTDFVTSIKKIRLNWYEIGEFFVYYYAYPTSISDPDPNNILASDGTVLDIADECAPALIHRIASALMRDENPYISDVLREDAQIAKSELVQSTQFEQGEQSIINNSNW